MRTRFLPPYSVYRFALWSFLLGLGTRWAQAGEAVQADFSVRLAGQSVGQLAVDMVTDTCLLGACTSLLPPARPPAPAPVAGWGQDTDGSEGMP